MSSRGETRIVVVNQHGDNRGDEAAMLGMVRGIGDRVTEPRFTIVHQFADRDSEVELPYPTTYLSMRLGPVHYARLLLHTILGLVGIRWDAILSRRGRAIVDSIRGADLVVSAPGGPYFGDLYAGHEVAHWLMVWIARRAGRPIGLYAPSCGPFRIKLLNVVRRRGFRWFDEVVLREGRSAAFLEDLTGIGAIVTTDSALQDVVAPVDRDAWAGPDERLLVVAVRKPASDPAEHDQAIVAAIEAVANDAPTAVVFLPQLHGRTHRDAPYLEGLAELVKAAASVTVAPETSDSRVQRGLIAAADLVIAGRYHPAVFSISSATPVLVIPYEHKAVGVAEAAGIAEWVTWVDDLRPDELSALALKLMSNDATVRAQLRESSVRLRELSTRTSETMVALIGS